MVLQYDPGQVEGPLAGFLRHFCDHLEPQFTTDCRGPGTTAGTPRPRQPTGLPPRRHPCASRIPNSLAASRIEATLRGAWARVLLRPSTHRAPAHSDAPAAGTHPCPFQTAADGLADARPQDSVPLGALKDGSYRDLRRLDSFVPDKSRHRLGNLVLLPPKLNSAVQDKPAKGKAAHYRNTGLLIAGEVADVIDPAGWNSRSIKERGGAAAHVGCRGVGGLIGGAGTSRRRGLQPGRVAVGSSQDCWCAGSARQRRPDVRRHATLPQAWMQRENWEFETHRLGYHRTISDGH